MLSLQLKNLTHSLISRRPATWFRPRTMSALTRPGPSQARSRSAVSSTGGRLVFCIRYHGPELPAAEEGRVERPVAGRPERIAAEEGDKWVFVTAQGYAHLPLVRVIQYEAYEQTSPSKSGSEPSHADAGAVRSQCEPSKVMKRRSRTASTAAPRRGTPSLTCRRRRNSSVACASSARRPCAGPSADAFVAHHLWKSNLRRVRPESPRRPPRHRRDTCSMAWRCRFLTARRSQRGHVIAEK